jgi:hypothetical protein
MVVNSIICKFSAYSNNIAVKHDQLWGARIWIKLCKSMFYVKMWMAAAGASSLC